MANQRKIPVLPETPEILAARSQWTYTGVRRPQFAESCGAQEESVWDYPRPPRIDDVSSTLRVFAGKQLVAESTAGKRVLETAGAPTYYFPPGDVDHSLIEYGDLSSLCEWKGVAQSVHAAGVQDAGWRYVRMFEAFIDLYEWVSFYPARVLCFVDIEQAQPQPGGYYGGWVTASLRGPVKGVPDSNAW